MTRREMLMVLNDVEFRDWIFYLAPGEDYLQVKFFEHDKTNPDTGLPTLQHGRKWKLSKHMTKSELVLTAFKAILTAVEHEVREEFRYKGRAILGPHIDVDKLYEVADDYDVREKVA
jgi:hypothetical protein